MKRTSRFYVANQIMHSRLYGNQFYFVPKSEVIGENVCRVVGKKYDVTDSIQPYLSAKYRRRKKVSG